jgi:transposase-like protein
MSKKVAEEMAALRGQRWTTREARRVLAAVDDSGLSLAAFAREHDLREQRLSWWRKRLGEWGGRDPAAEGTCRFVPAVVQEDARASTSAQLAVRLPDGVVIEIADVSPRWAVLLVRGLCEAAA